MQAVTPLFPKSYHGEKNIGIVPTFLIGLITNLWYCLVAEYEEAMMKKALRIDAIYATISLLCLMFINYYQTIFYYKKITPYSHNIDIIYEYFAIPAFYFFVAAFITINILDLGNYYISKTMKKILSYITRIVLIVYVLVVLIKIIGIITLPYVSFFSTYSIIFFLTGVLFALASHKK